MRGTGATGVKALRRIHLYRVASLKYRLRVGYKKTSIGKLYMQRTVQSHVCSIYSHDKFPDVQLLLLEIFSDYTSKAARQAPVTRIYVTTGLSLNCCTCEQCQLRLNCEFQVHIFFDNRQRTCHSKTCNGELLYSPWRATFFLWVCDWRTKLHSFISWSIWLNCGISKRIGSNIENAFTSNSWEDQYRTALASCVLPELLVHQKILANMFSTGSRPVWCRIIARSESRV